MKKAMSAYDRMVNNYVRRGGRADDARAKLEEAIHYASNPTNLGCALVYHGFCRVSNAERYATEIMTDRGVCPK